jgi:Asp-tRNA(Asn)/Glu-tRNA(Gln) amidotransferase C subunit
MQDDHPQTIRRLAATARIPLSEERIAALETALPFIQAQVALLAEADYREAEPAGRFCPRREETR